MLLVIFIPPVYNTVFMLVREKETRMKETMRMIGMTDRAYWFSWYIHYSLITVIVAALACCVLLINVLERSSPFAFLIMLVCYAQAIFAQVVCISTLLESSKNSGLIGSLVYFGLSLVSFPITQETVPEAVKVCFSVIP